MPVTLAKPLLDIKDQAAIPQLYSYKEAIASLEQVQHFLECHGMSVEANALSSTVDRTLQ